MKRTKEGGQSVGLFDLFGLQRVKTSKTYERIMFSMITT
jgi:hypothetical protein